MTRSRTAFLLASALSLTAPAALAAAANIVLPSQTGGPVTVTFVNHNQLFRDVRVAGHSYTVLPGQQLRVTGPQGTEIYADCNLGGWHRGAVIGQLSTESKDHRIQLK